MIFEGFKQVLPIIAWKILNEACWIVKYSVKKDKLKISKMLYNIIYDNLHKKLIN